MEEIRKETEHENKMGTVPVRKLLVSMAWPAVLSMTINALYNVVDSIFVAQVSEEALTAVSIVNPVQMLIIALSVGSGVGINSLISRRLGERRQEEADQAASTGIRIGLINYCIFLLIGLLLTKPFISSYAAKGTYIFKAASSYMTIICVASLFLNVQVVLEKILQSTGNMIAPMICGLTGAVVNIALDPILIFGLLGMPKLGVTGAAIATVTGQLCGMCIGVFIMVKGEHLVNVKIKGFKLKWSTVIDIYKVGLPSIIMQSIGSLMLILYNMILVAYSTTAVAVLGVYFKIQSFVFMPVFGLNNGMIPIIAYNYGAKNKDRMIKTFTFALQIAVTIMVVGAIVMEMIPGVILNIFNASESMLSMGITALKIICIHFPIAAFCIVTGSLFQALGKATYSMINSIMRQLVVLLPVAYLLGLTGNVNNVWWAFPIAELASATVTSIFYIRIKKTIISKI